MLTEALGTEGQPTTYWNWEASLSERPQPKSHSSVNTNEAQREGR